MEIKTYCWLDAESSINSVMAGENIMAPEGYDYYTIVDNWEIIEKIHLYKVVNEQLVLK